MAYMYQPKKENCCWRRRGDRVMCEWQPDHTRCLLDQHTVTRIFWGFLFVKAYSLRQAEFEVGFIGGQLERSTRPLLQFFIYSLYHYCSKDCLTLPSFSTCWLGLWACVLSTNSNIQRMNCWSRRQGKERSTSATIPCLR